MKKENAITLIVLVITIVILIILAGVVINLAFGDNGLLNKAKQATEKTKKQTAIEIMNLKITNIQISSYAETQTLPTLQYLSDKLCEDNDMEYVVLKNKEQASLEKIPVGKTDSILTKLKAYPYEFEINSSLQLASINGVQIASNDTTEYVSKSQYDSLLARVVALESNSNSSVSNNYSTEEQVIGTWIDGKSIYRKVFQGTEIHQEQSWQVVEWADISDLNIENIISSHVIGRDINSSYNKMTSFFPISVSTDNTKLNLCPQYNNIYLDTIIIEYTKTTDSIIE